MSFNENKEYTELGSLNYIGAVYRYFDSYTSDANDETKKTYMKRYKDYIFPNINPNVPISAYDETRINELFTLIEERSSLSLVSIQTDIRHLVYSPCLAYFSDKHNHVSNRNAFWGIADNFKYKNEDINSIELNIRKSLTVEEQILAAKMLLNPECENGEYIGLALMFFMGIRNNEACALKFGDIREMQNHNGCYYAQVYETVKIKSNTLKASGKTKNAPRRIPIMSVLKDMIDNRREFISKMLYFPYTDENGNEFKTIDDLPIACKGRKFASRCSADDLSKAGKTFLRQDLKMKEQQVSGISYYIEMTENTWEDIGEREVTTYLLRRNMATQIYLIGFKWDEIQYYMGHEIESANLIRSDYTDQEFLYHLWVLLNKHPLNILYSKHFSEYDNSIAIYGGEKVMLKITSKEIDDPISITIENANNIKIVEVKGLSLAKKTKTEVDIIKQLYKRYFQ